MEIKKFNEYIEEVNEAQMKIDGHIYDITTVPGDHGIDVKVVVGKDGIIGEDNNLITWENIDKLERIYRK